MINRHKKSFVVIHCVLFHHHMLEDGKKGNNKNKNEVCFCNPSSSSIGCFVTRHNLQLLWLMERDQPTMRRRKEKVL